MSKIARVVQKIFGSSAGVNQIAQFGSLAASAPAFTTNPATIQALSNYLTGWYGAVIGANSPAIEDMNALCYLYAYQLSYIMQAGIPEWDTDTVYYIGSLVSDGLTGVWMSITNTNTGNPLTSTSNWRQVLDVNAGYTSLQTFTANSTTNNVTMVGTAKGKGTVFLSNATGYGSSIHFNLPAPTPGMTFTIQDIAGQPDVTTIFIARNASEKIAGVTANYQCLAPYGSWTINCDGTDWYIS